VTAPIASGWSGCRVGLAPTGKRRLFTAHANSRHGRKPVFVWLTPMEDHKCDIGRVVFSLLAEQPNGGDR
jgi:hypothetical protein